MKGRCALGRGHRDFDRSRSGSDQPQRADPLCKNEGPPDSGQGELPAAAWIMLAIRFPGVSRPAPSDEMQSFGPAVGVMKVASDEEAIQLMNYSSYGLTASVGSPLCPLDPGADLRAAVERITIRCTTLDIQLAEGDGRRLFGSDPGHSLDAASAPSTPRDHSGRRQTIRCRATDAG